MGNPVFTKLENQWAQAPASSTTPAGYPTMPGYTVGANTDPAPTADPRSPYQSSVRPPSDDDFEHRFNASSADTVDRGRMTYDDVIMRTGMSFGVLLVVAAAGWMLVGAAPALGLAVSAGALLVGFVLAMVNSFSKTIRPALILAYAAVEGLALGTLSAVFEFMYPGIVVQALIATVAVFGVTLALFASGRVRNSPKLARFTLIALVALLVYRLINLVLSLTGVLSGGIDSMTVMGLPLGVVVGVVAVLIGAFCLIQDFDQAKTGVERGMPSIYAWSCAFGMMVTVVWMYVEILRLLSYLRNN
ncbi:Bax inhibitor-1/YccA family protein [Actinomyces sp. B33]|uniref:Bax inhibitor-1/YccA family protein n=1 Tax=Actinomyces sp. B33 TaxID=2942131 RepID=UPI0023412420|nr:Bax inhibitor-1/YccA family protein [Actinomyces sp. B33]MDC4232597.1 Bax inhibitor-1/YccA family protein [Actinomyces sp. B33]